MTSNNQFDLTPLYRNSIGLDRIMSHMVQRLDSRTTDNYPPYNIVKVSDDIYMIELAVAGFEESELTVTAHDNKLLINGLKADPVDVEYMHKGIALRKFTREFDLTDYMEVQSAVIKNGILEIAIVRNVPEEKKPKNIQIEYTG